MVKKQKRKIKICVYCGQLKEISKDHVIPKCLFTQPYPANLIVVPACDECNNAKSLNDDYLRDLLVTDNWGSQSETAQDVFQKTLSSQRQNSSVIAREAVKRAKLEPFYTNGGIYLDDLYAIPIDGERVERIFEMIVRGLFFAFQKERIPNDYIFELRRVHNWEFEEIKRRFSEHKPKGRVIGDVFSGGFAPAQEDRFTSMWLLIFYERIAFFASMIKPELQHKTQLTQQP